MTHSIAWDKLTNADVVRALEEYDRLGADQFFSEHGFAPTTTYELIWEERRYPPKAILGTAYKLATGSRLASGDFEGREDRRGEDPWKAGIHGEIEEQDVTRPSLRTKRQIKAEA